MHHIAIMNRSWDLIPKIVAGEKTIESRWYKTQRAPWNKVFKGDIVYFKNAGDMITASARVSNVLQFALSTIDDIQNIVAKYGKKICIVNPNPETWGTLPKYCMLIFLKDAQYVSKPFAIDKTGFGNAAAWLVVDDIEKIKIKY